MTATKRSAGKGILAHLRVPLYVNAYLLMLSSVLQSALGLPFWALAARLYSAHAVGIATTVLSAASLLATVGQLGLSTIIIRYLPIAHSASRRFVLICYGITTPFCLLLSAIALLTVGIWGPPVAFLRADPWWATLFIATTVTGVIFQFEDAVMVGLRQTRWVPLENGVFAVSRLAFVVLLAHASPSAGVVIASVGPGIVLPVIVNAAIFGRFLPRHLAAAGDRPAEYDVTEIRRLAVGNYAGSLAEFGALYLLPVIVTDQVGASTEAYFYIPWSIMLGLTVLAANMSSSLTVEAAGGGEDFRHKVLSALRVILGIIVPAALVVGIGAPLLLLAFGHGYATHGVAALRWMMASTIPLGLGSVGLAIARQRHDGRLVAASQISYAGCLFIVSVLLLPDYGITGVGIASFLAAMLSVGVVSQGLIDVIVPEARARARA